MRYRSRIAENGLVGCEADANAPRRSIRKLDLDGSGCPDRSGNIGGSRGGEVLVLVIEGSGSGEGSKRRKSDDSVGLHGKEMTTTQRKWMIRMLWRVRPE